MRTKFITLFALVLCMSAFIFPVSAYAMTDTTPPTVKAQISNDILRIEANDNDSGVEAVFINDKRYNYRVDGALELGAPEVAGDGETISVYAVDFAGNKSDAVTVKNPYYATPTETAVPAETQSSQAFTPDGTGTVLDDIVEQNGKEFFSITTDAGNIFYLIIDRYKDSENVYLLNAVTEDDLMALAETSGGKSESAVPTTPAVTTPAPDPSETETPAEPEEPAKDSGGNTGMTIFLVIAVLAVGGAGYYIKIVKPKQQAVDDDDDGEFEDDEEMEFEDEPEDGEESGAGDDYEEYGGEPEAEDE